MKKTTQTTVNCACGMGERRHPSDCERIAFFNSTPGYKPKFTKSQRYRFLGFRWVTDKPAPYSGPAPLIGVLLP